MSRSGYSDDCDGWDLIRWRGAVNSAIKGKRGQAFLRETLAALDAMPDKRLASESLVADGEYCTLGAVGAMRGMDLAAIDPYDRDQVAQSFGVSKALASEIMYENDEDFADSRKWVEFEIVGPVRPWYPEYGEHKRTICVNDDRAAEKRWSRMRAWVASHIKSTANQ